MKRLLVIGCSVVGSLLLVHHVSSKRVKKYEKIKHVQGNMIVTESGLKYEVLQKVQAHLQKLANELLCIIQAG